MAGNIGNAKIYVDYCKAGIDYVRVGLASGSMVDPNAYGFHYPMASLLLDISGVKNTSCAGLRHTKIVADGGIITPVDILKAIALGADYVMIGRSFVKLAEAAGQAFVKEKDGQIVNINPVSLAKMGKAEMIERNVQRIYAPISSYEQEKSPTQYDSLHSLRRISEATERTVRVVSTLQLWCLDMYDVFQNAFVLAKALTWKDYKTNIRFVKKLVTE
jgi:IMP dehydrogenase/GMP reductase